MTVSINDSVKACHLPLPKDPIYFELTDSAAIRDAMMLHHSFEPLLKKAMACSVESSTKNTEACWCSHPTEFSSTKKIFETTLTRHPDWRGYGICWEVNGKSYQMDIRYLADKFKKTCQSLHAKTGI